MRACDIMQYVLATSYNMCLQHHTMRACDIMQYVRATSYNMCVQHSVALISLG